MEEIAYRPQNVRETLVELKNISELSVDLGYAAAFYGYPGLADEVLALEERADTLQYPAKIALMLAAKRSTDAERLVGIVQIVEAAVDITSAAGDIAAIVTNEIGLPDDVRATLPAADEVVMRATVDDGSSVIGRTLGDLALDTEAGVRVIAIRRESEWNIAPVDGETIKAGDIVIGSGSEDGVESVREMLTGEAAAVAHPTRPDVEAIDRAAELVTDLKNISEIAIGLSYASVLFDDERLAVEVHELESQSDALKNDIETLVIEAGDDLRNPSQLRGLLHLATASEVICDAAANIADIVLRDGSVHPVFGQAIGESDELITTVTIDDGSEVAKKTLADLELEEKTGMLIMAIHRDSEWIFSPNGDARLYPGDVLIARGPKDGADDLIQLAQH